MQILPDVGERKILRVRNTILSEGLEDVLLHPSTVKYLIPLKLSGMNLNEVRDSLPPWSNRQAATVIDLLQLPYRDFYDFDAEWSVGRLKEMCREENLPLPEPGDR
jgi:hypothetical protein